MSRKFTYLLFFLFCSQAQGLVLHFVSLKIKPGYSCVALYGRMNEARGVFLSGDFAKRISLFFGAQYNLSTQAIVATGFEVDELVENLSYRKEYSGRSLLIVEPNFRLAFQDLIYDQIDKGLVKEILPQNSISPKAASVLRALEYAKESGIAFVLGKSVELKTTGKDKVTEIFFYRNSFFSFLKDF